LFVRGDPDAGPGGGHAPPDQTREQVHRRHLGPVVAQFDDCDAVVFGLAHVVVTDLAGDEQLGAGGGRERHEPPAAARANRDGANPRRPRSRDPGLGAEGLRRTADERAEARRGDAADAAESTQRLREQRLKSTAGSS
jgi:hypothetical protein